MIGWGDRGLRLKFRQEGGPKLCDFSTSDLCSVLESEANICLSFTFFLQFEIDFVFIFV